METPTFDSPLESTRLKFEVEFLSSADKFLWGISEKAKAKIFENIKGARVRQDSKVFKKLTNTLWEFRVNTNGSQYRLLAFWDKRAEGRPIVYITHAFIKKTSKVPPNELSKADKIRKQHFQNPAII